MRFAVATAALLLLLTACTTDGTTDERTGEPTVSATVSPSPTGTATLPPPGDTATASPDAPPTGPSTASSTVGPARFRGAAAMADVRLLAGRIGPRLATAPAFRRAGGAVAKRLRHLGYDVRRQGFRVPAGDSWGVPVRAGRSFNVVAEPPDFDPAKPHVLVGAHLDTIAVSPGAEDNASGVAVMLEVARLVAEHGTRLPVVFVAFGAEEPRGPGDDLHHFGSQHYVATMPDAQGDALRAMVSLDRVGVGRVVPVCTGPLSPPRVRDQLRRTAREVDVATQACENTASDHWSFEKAGFAVARLGSTSYAEYHSPADRPRVVDRRQLARVGRLTWAWLR